jgi:Flp pilus assembly protein TadG
MLDLTRSKFVAFMRRLMPWRIPRRFVRQQDGAVAVEFALVATPFIALTFAIVETSLLLFAGQTLETATADAARLIMTGQAQTNGFSQADFKNMVCAELSAMFDCNSVYVNVTTYATFADISTGSPIVSGKFNTSNMAYNLGTPNQIAVVSVYYEWPIYVSMFGNNLANLSNGTYLMIATSVFSIEPYQ